MMTNESDVMSFSLHSERLGDVLPGVRGDVPDIRFTDIQVHDEAKQIVMDTLINPIRQHQIYKTLVLSSNRLKTLLLYGPSGMGKSLFAKAIAGELGSELIAVGDYNVLARQVGDSEWNLSSLFHYARSRQERCIILFDQSEYLFRKSTARRSLALQLIYEMDKASDLNTRLCLLFHAIRPWEIDRSMLFKIGTHIYVGPPDAPARKAMLAYNLKEVPVAADLDFDDIVEQTDSYSGADLAEICDRAKRSALKRQLAGEADAVVGAQDFKDALARVRPSVTPAMMKDFDAWREQRTGPSDTGDDDE